MSEAAKICTFGVESQYVDLAVEVFSLLADERARQLVAAAVFQAQHAVDDEPAHHDGHPSPTARSAATGTLS